METFAGTVDRPSIGPLGGALTALGVVFASLVLFAPAASPARIVGVGVTAVVVSGAVAGLCFVASRSWRRYDRRRAVAWLLFGLCFTSVFLGDLVWAVRDLAFGTPPTGFDLGEAFFVLSYALVLPALVAMLARGGEERSHWLILGVDSLLFTLSVAGIGWELVVEPALAGSEGYVVAGAMVGPLSDLVLLFVLMVLFLGWERRRVSLSDLLLLGAMVLHVVGDVAFFVSVAAGIERAETLSELAFVARSLLVGFAALIAIGAASTRSASLPLGARGRGVDVDRVVRRVRQALPYVASAAAGGFLLLHLLPVEGMGPRETFIVISYCIALVCLAMVRQFLTIRENRLLAASLLAQTRRMELIDQVATGLSHCLTLDETLETGLEAACRAMRCSGGAIWLLREGDVPQVAVSQRLSREILIALGDGLRLDPMVGDWMDLEVDEPSAGSPVRLQVVPLVARNTLVGGMGLLADPDARDSMADRTMRETLGAQLGVAIENAQQYDTARYLADRDPLTGLLNHRALHGRLNQEIGRCERSGTELALVMMDLDNFKLFNDTYGHVSGDEILRTVAVMLEATVRASDIVGRYGGDELLAILVDTGPEGALETAERLRAAVRREPFVSSDGSEVPILLSFGIASFPEHGRRGSELVRHADANLYASKRRGGDAITAVSGGELPMVHRSGMFSVLDGLVAVVDGKDHYTRVHSQQVTDYALLLAGRVGLSAEERSALRIAGLLHDVGKIGVPDAMLRKPGALGHDEIDILRQHTLLGELVIKDVPHLASVTRAVGSHHERWDGEGYPRGLAGDAIPVMGRILAVADAYSAMISDRPYRAALSSSEACAELERVAGTQLDPVLTAEFLSILAESA